jgi:hypothetical protein
LIVLFWKLATSITVFEVSKIKKLTTKVGLPVAVVVKLNAPVSIVEVPSYVPSIKTLAPVTGFPFSSTTLPEIVFCEKIVRLNNRIAKVKIDSRLLFE